MDDKGRIINLDKPIMFDAERLRELNGLAVSNRGDADNGFGGQAKPESGPYQKGGSAMMAAKLGLGFGLVCSLAVGLNWAGAYLEREWAAYKRELAEAAIVQSLEQTEFELDLKTKMVATDMTPTQLKRALFAVEQARQQCEMTIGMVRDTVIPQH